MSTINCRALYPYNGIGGEQIETLTFEAGEVIKVVYSGDTGWWEGEKNGIRGWFPASYVKKLQETDVSSLDSDEWKEVQTDSGEAYYVNTRTHATSWEIPTVIASPTSQNEDEPKRFESPVNSSNNVNGNSLHLSLPLTEKDGPLHSVSQPTTPGFKSDEPSTPQSKSLPITPRSSPSPVPTRSKKVSTVSTPTTPVPNGHSPKPRIRMLNGISFPDEKEAKEQTLLQPGKFSYCDYFWSDRIENHNYQSGFSVIYQKMLKGKQMCKEMSELFKAREALEVQYARGLATLANSILASQEGGTLGDTLKQVKVVTMQESKIHQDFANKLRAEIAQPLVEQKDAEKKELKKLEASVAEVRKQVHLKYQAAERAKQLLLERTKDFESKRNSMKHSKEDVQKARRKSTRHAEDLTHALDAYNKQRQVWFEEVVTSSLVLERHEVSRINNVKKLLSHYSKIMRETNTSCNTACDVINEHLKKTDADKDRELWVRKNATGKVKPVDLVI